MIKKVSIKICILQKNSKLFLLSFFTLVSIYPSLRSSCFINISISLDELHPPSLQEAKGEILEKTKKSKSKKVKKTKTVGIVAMVWIPKYYQYFNKTFYDMHIYNKDSKKYIFFCKTHSSEFIYRITVIQIIVHLWYEI